MKIRIISAVIAILLLGAVIICGILINPIIFTVAMALLSATAVYEMLHNAYRMKSKVVTVIATIYALLIPFIYSGYITFINSRFATVIFIVFIFMFAIMKNKIVTAAEMLVAVAVPLLLGFSFYSVAALFRNGLIFFILTLNFAWSCDTFAYFTGICFGKHKVTPVISPKKSWEGCIGGVIGTVIVTFLICFIYNKYFDGDINTLFLVLVSPVMAVIGMYGDLTASYIKRMNHIKDYGKIMPGHGGVMDRFDSICLVSPVVLVTLEMAGII